jgi:hypothetical protein
LRAGVAVHTVAGMEFELDLFGPQHLHHVHVDELTRDRYIKSPQTAASKWNSGTQAAGGTWSTGIAQTT